MIPIIIRLENQWLSVDCDFTPSMSSSMTYESATNELPLSSISFKQCPSTPDDDHTTNKSNFDDFYCSSQESSRNEMSPLATNERPLSCTCLPKLLTEINDSTNNLQNSSATSDDDEFMAAANVRILSTSDPFPRSNFSSELSDQICSADFLERLNDYHYHRDQRKKSLTPRILINDALPKLSDFRAMRKASLQNETTIDIDIKHNSPLAACSTNSPEIQIVTPLTTSNSQPNISISITNQTSICVAQPNQNNKLPLSIDLFNLNHKNAIHNNRSDRMNSCTNNTITKKSISTTKITSSTTTTTTNVNNKTIPHPNVKIHNSDATQTTQTTVRRQRHSLSGQMGFFKIMDIAGGFSRKMATSTNSLFSTAVISGSSSAPNLRDMIPNASPSGIVHTSPNKSID